MWVLYWSMLEFGLQVLSMEDAWFCVTAKRSSDVNLIDAGIAQVFGSIIKLFFGGHDTFDLAQGGMVLVGPDGGRHRLFVKLHFILQDGSAHKLVWGCKGDAGTKFCMLCRNAFSEKSELVDEDGTELLTCSIIDEEVLSFATNDDIRGAVRRLAAFQETDSVGDFKLREQAIGFTHHPRSILLDPLLDGVVHPVSQFMHDWMHAMFVHGVWNTMLFLLLETLLAHGMADIWERLYTYISAWTWPRRMACSTLKTVFKLKRKKANRKAKFFKCTASEGLSLYGVIAFYMHKVILPHAESCRDEILTYLSLCDVLDMLVVAPYGVISQLMLHDAIHTFLQKCIDCGWRAFMHPKFHWLKHLHQHELLLTCWVHERKHKMVKRYGTDVSNTSVYEQSILNQVTAHHLTALSKPDKFSTAIGLVGAHPARRKLIEFVLHELDLGAEYSDRVTTALDARCVFGACRKGDVVLVRSPADNSIDAGEVWFHCDVAGKPLSLVSIWDPVAVDTAMGAAEFRVKRNPELCETSDILMATIHTHCREGVVRTLLPCHLRN